MSDIEIIEILTRYEDSPIKQVLVNLFERIDKLEQLNKKQ
jgi:hypothetical protein